LPEWIADADRKVDAGDQPADFPIGAESEGDLDRVGQAVRSCAELLPVFEALFGATDCKAVF